MYTFKIPFFKETVIYTIYIIKNKTKVLERGANILAQPTPIVLSSDTVDCSYDPKLKLVAVDSEKTFKCDWFGDIGLSGCSSTFMGNGSEKTILGGVFTAAPFDVKAAVS